MYSIEKLKLNRTVECYIPRNKDLFGRVGPREIPVNGSGEDSDLIPMNQRVIDQLEYMDKYDTYMQRQENDSRVHDVEKNANDSPHHDEES